MPKSVHLPSRRPSYEAMIKVLRIPEALQKALLAIMQEDTSGTPSEPAANLQETQSTPRLSVQIRDCGDERVAQIRKRFTPEEMRILALVTKGYRNTEIAREFKIPEENIKKHLRAVYGKARVHDRLGLALFVFANRLLTEAEIEGDSRLEGEVLARAAVAS